jgi:hypothetical protein
MRSELLRRLSLPQGDGTRFPSLRRYELDWVRGVFRDPAHLPFRATGFPMSGPAAPGHPTAGSLVEGYMRTQAALHSPDQIAGGGPSLPDAGLTGLGSTRVNSSIGAQWPTRIASIQSTLLNHLSVGWSYPAGAPRCGPLTSDAARERVRLRVVLGPVQ